MHFTVLCGNKVILQATVLTNKITLVSLEKATHYQWVSSEVLQSRVVLGFCIADTSWKA